MGHKRDIEARYTTNKGRLTDEMITDMRRAYSKSQEFLCTISGENNSSQNKKEMPLDMWREQAKLYGIDPVKIKIEKQRIASSTDANDKIFSDIEQQTNAIRQEIMKAMSVSQEKHQQQAYDGKIITNDEQLLHYICQGWEPIKELAENRIIIRRRK